LGIKVIHKARKRQHQNPLIGDEISKSRGEKYTGLQLGMKLRFSKLEFNLESQYFNP
jgi:hypothetical protein